MNWHRQLKGRILSLIKLPGHSGLTTLTVKITEELKLNQDLLGEAISLTDELLQTYHRVSQPIKGIEATTESVQEKVPLALRAQELAMGLQILLSLLEIEDDEE